MKHIHLTTHHDYSHSCAQVRGEWPSPTAHCKNDVEYKSTFEYSFEFQLPKGFEIENEKIYYKKGINRYFLSNLFYAIPDMETEGMFLCVKDGINGRTAEVINIIDVLFALKNPYSQKCFDIIQKILDTTRNITYRAEHYKYLLRYIKNCKYIDLKREWKPLPVNHECKFMFNDEPKEPSARPIDSIPENTPSIKSKWWEFWKQ